MAKSNLYTRTGDAGTTSLVGGGRISKDACRLMTYGVVDELSAHLGVVISSPECPKDVREALLEVQNRMFDIGCNLATQPASDFRPQCPSLALMIDELEAWIDKYDELTPKVNAFILPGGTPLSAATHVARTVCRRAECAVVGLSSCEWVDPMVMKFLNRLSDFLFILARYFNYQAGVEEIVWKPAGKTFE